jgi:hypothetical protein
VSHATHSHPHSKTGVSTFFDSILSRSQETPGLTGKPANQPASKQRGIYLHLRSGKRERSKRRKENAVAKTTMTIVYHHHYHHYHQHSPPAIKTLQAQLFLWQQNAFPGYLCVTSFADRPSPSPKITTKPARTNRKNREKQKAKRPVEQTGRGENVHVTPQDDGGDFASKDKEG